MVGRLFTFHRWWLTMLLVGMAWSSGALGQTMQVQSYQRPMRVERKEKRIAVSFDIGEVYTNRFKKRLSSGFTSRVLLEVQLLVGNQKVPSAQALVETVILYDIWEERFAVRISGSDGQQELQLKTMDELIAHCASVKNLMLNPLLEVPKGSTGSVEVKVLVNLTSPELLRKVKDYLANPDGQSGMGTTKFFGKFSQAFVNEKDFEAEAMYTYRSPPLELP